MRTGHACSGRSGTVWFVHRMKRSRCRTLRDFEPWMRHHARRADHGDGDAQLALVAAGELVCLLVCEAAEREVDEKVVHLRVVGAGRGHGQSAGAGAGLVAGLGFRAEGQDEVDEALVHTCASMSACGTPLMRAYIFRCSVHVIMASRASCCGQ